jgi:hypothetical protein
MKKLGLTIGFLLASGGVALAGAPVTDATSPGRATMLPLAMEIATPAVELRPRVRAGRRVGVVRPGRRPVVRPGVIARPGVVRPGRIVVRPWRPRPHYGALVAGVALGALVTVAVVGSAPAAPASNVCWYWQDPARTQGYWDYCY